MIFIVNAENRGAFDADLQQMHRDRKRVFVDDIGWQVPVRDDMEVDSYDRIDTTYLIARCDKDGSVLASSRLLPTMGPHLMSDLFAHACNDGPPTGPRVWEASRFCFTPSRRCRRTRLLLLWQTFCAIMETCLLFGIEHVTFTANAALLPLALDCGWDARVLGPTLPDGRDQITAVGVRVTTEGLRAIRERFGIAGPITRFITSNI